MNLNLSKDARDFLDKLQSKQFKQVTTKIFALLKDAYPTDAKHLEGHPGYRRVDSGEYRVCYFVEDSVIHVTAAGKRNDDDVYRKLGRKA